MLSCTRPGRAGWAAPAVASCFPQLSLCAGLAVVRYSLAICRGLTQEGAGGTKRCIGPRDMDLEVVSRTFYQAFTVRQDNIYIVRASSTSQQWQEMQAVAREAVQSFRLPAALA